MRSLALIFIMVVALLQSACSATPEHQTVRERDVVVAVSVVDGDGKPVPYSEIWRVVTPILQRPDQYARRAPDELSLDYLDRVVERYKYVAEFAGPWRPGFRAALENGISTHRQFTRLVPANDSGETSEILKVERDRPTVITVRYAGLSNGYQPTLVERAIGPSESRISVRIVLRGDSARSVMDPALTKAFGKLRFDATPGSAGYKGERQMEEQREQMLALATAAEAAGEKAAAARIFAWVPFIPTRLTFDNTSESGMRISGYRREDETSDRNLAILHKAYALDPNNRYLRMKHLFLSPPAGAMDQVRQLEDLLAGGDDMWPDVYFLLEDLYHRLGRLDDARRMFARYETVEPQDMQNLPRYKKLRLARYVSLEEFRDTYIVAGDVNKTDMYHWTPMLYAAHSGRVDIFDWLLKQGVSTPLAGSVGVQALVSRNPAMVRRLLETEAAVVGRNVTLPRFHVHQIDGNFLMNGGRYGQEGVDCEPTVHR